MGRNAGHNEQSEWDLDKPCRIGGLYVGEIGNSTLVPVA